MPESVPEQNFPELTSALEDYLETIYELVRDRKLARIKDIAKARGVKAGSVSPAMRRLAELGLINYVQREYIDLTPDGERLARRVLAKHRILTRFFTEVLGMPMDLADRDACAMEHSLSPAGMDHMVRFFEFLKCCPGGDQFLDRYHRCSLTTSEAAACGRGCPALTDQAGSEEECMSLMDVKPGESARVTQINGSGAIRQRLLDMGLLPDVLIEVQRVAPVGDPIWIKLQGFQLSLRKSEAAAVLVEAV